MSFNHTARNLYAVAIGLGLAGISGVYLLNDNRFMILYPFAVAASVFASRVRKEEPVLRRAWYDVAMLLILGVGTVALLVIVVV